MDIKTDKRDKFKALKTKLNEAEEALKKEKEDNQKNQDEAAAVIKKAKDDNLLLLAEFENFRRRKAAEHLELINTASEKIILELLPVLDDCERALKSMSESSDNASAKEGVELIFTKLTGILQAKGLSRIEAAGKDFDTDEMEAVAQFPTQDEEQKNKVMDVVQNGYKLGEKVIRFAKVVVGQ